jgi:hypothetical protein
MPGAEILSAHWGENLSQPGQMAPRTATQVRLGYWESPHFPIVALRGVYDAAGGWPVRDRSRTALFSLRNTPGQAARHTLVYRGDVISFSRISNNAFLHRLKPLYRAIISYVNAVFTLSDISVTYRNLAIPHLNNPRRTIIYLCIVDDPDYIHKITYCK